MRTRSLSAAAAALLLFAAPAGAQDAAPEPAATEEVAADTTPRTSLQKDAWSLSFQAPTFGSGGGSGEFGVWQMVGSRTNVGLALGIRVSGTDYSGDRDQTDATTAASLGLNVRRYLTAPREVTPYLQGTASIGGSYQRQEGSDGYSSVHRGAQAGVAAAVGAEWFPVRRMSLAGHTGFGLFAGRVDLHQEAPDDTEFDQDGSTLQVNSFTTALTLQIYF